MRSRLLVLLLALLALPSAAADHLVGPYAGSVVQGETDLHPYDNAPHDGGACPDVLRWYVVKLTYAPATDTLGLSANGLSTVATNGAGALRFQADYCTAFTIAVTGLSVALRADYVVTVETSL